MILVLGAGVIGVTTAYYLAKAGHAVTVIDQQPDVALETSYANAGEVSPGYASPWAAPDIPLKAVKWLLTNGPLVIRPGLDPRMYRWILQFLFNCRSSAFYVNKARMLQLAEYSRVCLGALRQETDIQYDARQRGTLQLFRTRKQIDGVAGDVRVLQDFDVPYELLDAEGCIAAEPALAKVADKIAGGLRFPQDETGDCFLFTKALAAEARSLGVKFVFNTQIERLRVTGGKISGVVTSTGEITGDAYVVALGSYSPLLSALLGLTAPVYPVKGYSLTFPVSDEASSPQSTIMDETFKVAITRLGDRIRVGGTAELAGYDLRLRASRRLTLERSVNDLLPDSSVGVKKQFWCGLRPMTPDGTPIIGPTSFANLYLNTGHGTLGWTMACGSGRLLADLVTGQAPELRAADFSLARYRRESRSGGLSAVQNH